MDRARAAGESEATVMRVLAKLAAAVDRALHREDMTGDGVCPVPTTEIVDRVRWEIAA